MSITYTTEQFAEVKPFEAFELFNDYDYAIVTFANGIEAVYAPFSVHFEDHGATITVHDDTHGAFDILSPKYNNLYMHNLKTVTFK
jgi:hypothetical protein